MTPTARNSGRTLLAEPAARRVFCCRPRTRWRSAELTRGADMTEIWALAALWLGLALAATLLSIWLRIATAMSEIVIGTVAQLALGAFIGGAVLGTDQSW